MLEGPGNCRFQPIQHPPSKIKFSWYFRFIPSSSPVFQLTRSIVCLCLSKQRRQVVKTIMYLRLRWPISHSRCARSIVSGPADRLPASGDLGPRGINWRHHRRQPTRQHIHILPDCFQVFGGHPHQTLQRSEYLRWFWATRALLYSIEFFPGLCFPLTFVMKFYA